MSIASSWKTEIHELFCAVCGSQVLASGRCCPHCGTPTAVSLSVSRPNRRNKSKLISVLGASGAGKTVFLGMLLDMLGRGSHGLRGVPNGTFSMAVQDQTVSALENRRFPDKTPSESDKWNWIHCEAFYQRKPKIRMDLVTPDVAGEVLASEVEGSGTSLTIRHLGMYSDAMIILLDSTLVRDEANREDSFAVKLVNYIATQQIKIRDERRGRVRLPFAFVLTKTDICPDAELCMKTFIESNLPGLNQLCKSRLLSYEFFAASVTGTTLYDVDEDGACVSIPPHIQPRGIVEPLHWTLGKLEKKWRKT